MKKLLIINALCFLALSLFAQEKAKPKAQHASPEAAFTQELGVAEIQVAYARPLAKGRKIFGGLVPFDSLWRTGAGDCTTLAFNEAMTVGSKKIVAGKYSLFTIPTPDEWTIIINSETKMHGTNGYAADKDISRFKVKSMKTDRFYETFTIEVNDITPKGEGFLNIMWENTMVKIPLKSEGATASETAMNTAPMAKTDNMSKTEPMPKMDNHAGHDMSKMKNTEGAKTTETKPKTDVHAGHDMSTMKNTEGDKKMETKPKTDAPAGHDMATMKDMKNMPDMKGMTPDLKAQFAPILAAYYDLKNALVADNSALAATKGKAMKAALIKINTKDWTAKERVFYEPLAKKLETDAEHIGDNAAKIDHQREHFITLSSDMASVTKTLKINDEASYLLFCPMANNGKGAFWLSQEDKVKNPYYGKSMLTCGSVKETLK